MGTGERKAGGPGGQQDRTESERTLVRVPRCFPALRLLFCGGKILPDAPRLALRPGQTLIGRSVDERQGISLPESRRTSREHAVVEVGAPEPGAEVFPVRIRDLETKNGTYVNGARVPSAVLRDGDVVRVGDAVLLLRHEAADPEDAPLGALAGVSLAVRALRCELVRVATAPAPVLLLGESGTGKELAARALHEHSGRRGRLVAVNCSAIPEALAESQLFGHQSGSFTSASAEHEGWFRAAQAGTLLLDEVGELPLALQPKLLRALEEGQVTPVGSTRPRPVDVRVIAATNRELKTAVSAGRFRADLYARLCALVIELPPLRARKEDVLLLLKLQLGPAHPPLTTALAEALLLYDWPLNVRELVQLAAHLRYAVGKSEELDVWMVKGRLPLSQPPLPETAPAEPAQAPHLSPDQVPDQEPDQVPDLDERGPPARPLPRAEVETLLRQHHGIVTRVAAAVGRSPRQIRRWIDQYGISYKGRSR